MLWNAAMQLMFPLWLPPPCKQRDINMVQLANTFHGDSECKEALMPLQIKKATVCCPPPPHHHHYSYDICIVMQLSACINLLTFSFCNHTALEEAAEPSRVLNY